MSYDTLPCDLVRIALKYYKSLGTPFADSLAEKLVKGDWDGIARSSVNPRDYDSAELYFLDACASAFLKKYPKLPTKIDKRAAAIKKWRDGEIQCYRANERLTKYLPEFKNSSDRILVVDSFLESVKKIILSWIGPSPDSLNEGRFGPGSTFSDKAGRTTVPDKMSSVPVMTRDAWAFLPQWLGTAWGTTSVQHHGKIDYVRGNRYATAPKTALTDRSIGVEPSINVFYQLGLGRQLRKRLLRNGHWNLALAQELHRLVAESSSVSREFCTLDLSNASDTLCKVLVKILLPPNWFDQLDSLRSKFTLLDGKWVLLEKFSSMGNGFTFELETIIFAAIAVVVTRECGHPGWLGRDVFVFGDDIIVRNDVARPLESALEFLGFSLNKEKSFYGNDRFRESCGGDFFDKKNVRPYYLKGELNGPQDYVALANGISAIIDRRHQFCGEVDRSAWFSVLDNLPSRVRCCRGPRALGDTVIHDRQENWSTRTRSSIRYLKVFRPDKIRKVSFEVFRPDVILACATYGTGGSKIWGVIPRDAVLSYKVGWKAYS